MAKYELHHGDCLEEMPKLPNLVADLVLTDLPYGLTACKWDSVIPFEPMWAQLKRIAKPKAAICLFGSQPFTSALVMSNPKMFRYEWIWEKNVPSGFANARRQPMRNHEQIVIFALESPTYIPEKERREHNDASKERYKYKFNSFVKGVYPVYGGIERVPFIPESISHRYPTTIKRFDCVAAADNKRVHPTQKPVELLRYLIRTYTNEGETVLDFTMGSGSTGVACELENRNFIGIEKDADYFKIAQKRIADVKAKEPLFMEAAA